MSSEREIREKEEGGRQKNASDKPKTHQHFVPRFYLRHFALDKEGKNVYAFDKSVGRIKKLSIRDVCVKKNLYEAKTAFPYCLNMMEDALARWENCFSELMSAIAGKISSETNPTMSIAIRKEEFLIHYMMFFQLFRLERLLHKIGDMMPISNLDMNQAEIEKQKYLFNLYCFGFIDDEELPNPIIPCIADVYQQRNTLVFLYIRDSDSNEFITSDCPVGIVPPMEFGFGSNQLRRDNAVFVYPMTPKIAVISCPRKVCPEHMSNKVILPSKEWVDKCNALACINAERWVIGRNATSLQALEKWLRPEPEPKT